MGSQQWVSDSYDFNKRCQWKGNLSVVEDGLRPELCGDSWIDRVIVVAGWRLEDGIIVFRESPKRLDSAVGSSSALSAPAAGAADNNVSIALRTCDWFHASCKCRPPLPFPSKARVPGDDGDCCSN